MSTVSQIILDAYRQSNLLAIGTAPTSAENEEALRHLNRIVDSVFGYEVGEGYKTVDLPRTVDSNVWPISFPEQSVRLMCALTSPTTIKLPTSPEDGTRFAVVDVAKSFDVNPLTVEGSGRSIDGGPSALLFTAGETREWFYRDDIASWVQWKPLQLTSEFPFSEKFDPYFIGMLAMSINPAYGIVIDQQSAMLMNRSKSQFRSQYTTNRMVTPEMGYVFMPNTVAGRCSIVWQSGSFEHGDL